jgi:hypothetical protein
VTSSRDPLTRHVTPLLRSTRDVIQTFGGLGLDGIIYLRTEPPVCAQRLAKRAREEEEAVSIEYLQVRRGGRGGRGGWGGSGGVGGRGGWVCRVGWVWLGVAGWWLDCFGAAWSARRGRPDGWGIPAKRGVLPVTPPGCTLN